MTKQDIEELLPFYVNGTLSESENRRVEELLATHEDLRAEVETLRAIRAEMKANDPQSPGEFGLARLMRDIKSEAQPPRPDRTWIWQVAAAVAIALFVGQNILTFGTSDPGIELAGDGGSHIITVGFAPEATEASIRGLLLELDLEITAGPSALGLYELSTLGDDDPATLVERLEGASGVVDIVDWEGE